ncbi:putative porin [Candidatus Parabeggiatoa sp. HSG14]|uniref:putative porin n=1 Tax=Candidatus Parabeggiatoa sp. HSG14 TaxID=3055593 RepID=UPI0025A833D3|nr:putative porin [Thiotrichales bacterium HSG14]
MDRIANKLRQALPTLVAGILTTCTMVVPNTVQADISLSGDFRFRLEADWDSHKTNGSEREDRNRARIRARVNLNYDHEDWLAVGARLRSGSDDNHVSPHITIVDFDDNNTGDAHFNLDKWFFKVKNNGAWGWVGRNSIPFWKQNEMFWDDDATPAGIAAGFKKNFGGTGIAINTGYLSLPAGMQKFSGSLGLAQAVLSTKVGANKFTAAAGFMGFYANPENDKDAEHKSLWDNNGKRDYRLWIASLQGKFKAGTLPLALGLDYMHNAKGYSETDIDPFTAANHDDTDGYVFSAKLGQLKNKGDWLLGYYYSHIETFAVNSSYAQDDWGRWNEQGSNIKGHEFRAAYQAVKNLNIVARFYSVETITDDPQDGNRFRIDFNLKF